jgi:short-subunit dehydrogenase
MSAQLNSPLKTDAMRAKYGPWALIAGASEGTGAEFARQLAALGLNCVLVARRLEPLQRLSAELQSDHNVQTRVLTLDLCAEDAAERMRAAAADLEIGLYVSNAGADSSGMRFLDAPLDKWHGLLNMNVRTVMDAVYFFASAMKPRGRGGVLLMSSGAALGGQPRLAMYSGTKAFEVNFAESLWAELKSCGIDVVSIAAPAMDTPVLREALKRKNLTAEQLIQPADVVRIALAELSAGPTYVFPLDPSQSAQELNAARRARLLQVTEITKLFFGSE